MRTTNRLLPASLNDAELTLRPFNSALDLAAQRGRHQFGYCPDVICHVQVHGGSDAQSALDSDQSFFGIVVGTIGTTRDNYHLLGHNAVSRGVENRVYSALIRLIAEVRSLVDLRQVATANSDIR